MSFALKTLEDGEHEGRFAEAVALRDVHVFETEKIVDRALALGPQGEGERRVAFGENEVGRARDEDRGLEGRHVVTQKGRLHLGGFGLEDVGARSRTRRQGLRVHVGGQDGRRGRERQKKRERKQKGKAFQSYSPKRVRGRSKSRTAFSVVTRAAVSASVSCSSA